MSRHPGAFVVAVLLALLAAGAAAMCAWWIFASDWASARILREMVVGS